MAMRKYQKWLKPRARKIIEELEAENFVIDNVISDMMEKKVKRIAFSIEETPVYLRYPAARSSITIEGLKKLKMVNEAKKKKLQEEFGL